jgi:hypothetical protein
MLLENIRHKKVLLPNTQGVWIKIYILRSRL